MAPGRMRRREPLSRSTRGGNVAVDPQGTTSITKEDDDDEEHGSHLGLV
jgi:hypothetical protein